MKEPKKQRVIQLPIDLDRDNEKESDGQALLSEWGRTNSSLHETVESRTPRGGAHLIYSTLRFKERTE